MMVVVMIIMMIFHMYVWNSKETGLGYGSLRVRPCSRWNGNNKFHIAHRETLDRKIVAVFLRRATNYQIFQLGKVPLTFRAIFDKFNPTLRFPKEKEARGRR